MNLEGKTVLIPGSSSGIGRETALQLARERCRLILTYFKGEAAGKGVLKECLNHGEAALYRLDVRDDRSVRRLVKSVTDRFSSLDILINVAGVMAENPTYRAIRGRHGESDWCKFTRTYQRHTIIPAPPSEAERSGDRQYCKWARKGSASATHRILRDKVGCERFYPRPCPGTSRAR